MRHIEPTTWQLLQEDRLNDKEMSALLEHLEDCPDCQARYMEAIPPRFEELAELLVPDDFTLRTMQRIEKEHQSISTLNGVSSSQSILVKSHLTPTRLFRQKLTAYAVAASLTMALMAGGVFTQLSSLPRLQSAPTGSITDADDTPLTVKSEMLGPLLPQTNVISSVQQPFKLPPLRLLVERSITNVRKK